MIDLVGIAKKSAKRIYNRNSHIKRYSQMQSAAKGTASDDRVMFEIASVHASRIENNSSGVVIEDEAGDPQIVIQFARRLTSCSAALYVKIASISEVNPFLYLDLGKGFNEDDKIRPTSVNGDVYKFNILLSSQLAGIRLDPHDGSVPVTVSGIEIFKFKSSKIRSEGIEIFNVKDIIIEDDDSVIGIMSNDPIIEFKISSKIKKSKYSLLKFTAKGLFGTKLNPKVYLGPSESESFEVYAVEDTYTAILVDPKNIEYFRFDPSEDVGTAIISKIEATAVTEADIQNLFGGDNFLPLGQLSSESAIKRTLEVNRHFTGTLVRRALIPGGKVTDSGLGRVRGAIWGDSSSAFQPFVDIYSRSQLVGSTQATLSCPGDLFYQEHYSVYNFDAAYSPDRALPGAMLSVRIRGMSTELDGSPLVSAGAENLQPSLIDIRRRAALDAIDIRLQMPLPKSMLTGPKISILTPVYNVHETWLFRMIESVLRQSYQNWELILVDDASTNPKVRYTLERFKKVDKRIKVKYREANGGISAATNDALDIAEGEYIALVDNDDMITSDALEEMVIAILRNSGADFLYSDECKIDKNDRSCDLFAKPDWSPLFLLNYMYTGHLTLYRTFLVRELGGFRSAYDLSQDYDMALRVSERASKIIHVEKCLYAWRMIEGSGSQGGKPAGRITNIAALQDASDRRGWNGRAIPLPTANRLVRSIGEGARVSIIVPSDNATNISDTVKSIDTRSTYKNYEIIVVTNSRIVDELTEHFPNVSFVKYDKPYNFSDKCNEGAQIATGDFVAFFNDDVRVVSPDWIECLLEYLTLPGVGVVGPKLTYENGLIQHAGMVTGVRRLVGTAFHAYAKNTLAHFNMAQCVREVSLICGALLAMPKTVFREVGGFDAVNTPINHSDVDLCFKIRAAGYACVYTPHAELIHIGHMSLAVVDASQALEKKARKDRADIFILNRWGHFLSQDPYFTESMRNLIYLDSQEEFKLFYPDRAAPSEDSAAASAVIISHDLTGSGAPKIVFDMAAALREQGTFVTVISPSDGSFREPLLSIGAAVVIDPLVLSGNENSLCIVKNFDTIIVNTILGWLVVDKLAGTEGLHWYIHETDLINEIARGNYEFERVVKSSKDVWVGSELSSNVLKKYGAQPKLLTYGVNKPWSVDLPAHVRIAVFASYEPRKGQDLAVLAFKALPKHIRASASLKFFGRILDTGFRMAVENMAEDVKEIEFCSALSYARYQEELEQSDVILVSSRDDTLPLVSLDALACGKILICGKATGTSKYLKNGVSGFVYGESTPDEITPVLLKVIGDENLRAKVSKGGYALYKSKFTLEEFKHNFQTLLSETDQIL